MKFPAITLVVYLGASGLDEGSTLWAQSRRPELREAMLRPAYRIPLRVGSIGLNTFGDSQVLRNRKKTRRVYRVLAVGLQVTAAVIAIKHGRKEAK